jgi:hypothetical protein
MNKANAAGVEVTEEFACYFWIIFSRSARGMGGRIPHRDTKVTGHTEEEVRCAFVRSNSRKTIIWKITGLGNPPLVNFSQ